MPWPRILVDVSFTTGPFAVPVWTNIHDSTSSTVCFVNRIEIKWGRARELEGFEAGTAELELDNYDRRFDPEETTGPYYNAGNGLLPNKQIRIRAINAGITYDLFYGFVDDWPQDYSRDGERTVTIKCTDLFKLLATMPLPSVYEQEVLADTPYVWLKLDETTGTTLADSSGNARDSTMASIASVERSEALRVDGPPGFSVFPTRTVPVAVPPSGALTFETLVKGSSYSTDNDWSYSAYSTTNPVVPQLIVNFGDGAGTGNRNRIKVHDGTLTNYYASFSGWVFDDKLHHVAVVHDPTNLANCAIFVDGIDVTATRVGTAWDFGRAGAKGPASSYSGSVVTGAEPPQSWHSDLAVYTGMLSAARILAHAQAATLAWKGDLTSARVARVLTLAGVTNTDIDTGINTLGPTTPGGKKVLEYLQACEAGESGQLYVNHRDGKLRFESHRTRMTAARSTAPQYTFSDDPAGVGVYRYTDLDITRRITDVYNEVPVTWSGGEVSATDAASATAYGKRALSAIETELETKPQAQAMAEWVLSRYKDLTIKVRQITVEPSAHSTAHFLPCLDVKVSDRVTVRRRPTNASAAIQRDVVVEGITHVIENGQNRWRTTFACSGADAANYWIWDTSTWDTSTRWGY